MEKGGGKGRRRNLFYLKREGGRGREDSEEGEKRDEGEGEERKRREEEEFFFSLYFNKILTSSSQNTKLPFHLHFLFSLSPFSSFHHPPSADRKKPKISSADVAETGGRRSVCREAGAHSTTPTYTAGKDSPAREPREHILVREHILKG